MPVHGDKAVSEGQLPHQQTRAVLRRIAVAAHMPCPLGKFGMHRDKAVELGLAVAAVHDHIDAGMRQYRLLQRLKAAVRIGYR